MPAARGDLGRCGRRVGRAINPLRMQALPKWNSFSLDESAENSRLSSPLALQAQRLRTFFELYLRDLTDPQRAYLDQALLDIYAEFGISWETNPATVTRWPTMKDLYRHLCSRAEKDPANWEELALYLRSAAEGIDSGLWCGDMDLGESTDILVLDVHNLNNLPENVKRAQYFNVLTYTWDLNRRDRTEERKLLIVDEAWVLADPKVPTALEFLRELSKRIAKYKRALVTITQNVVDFLASDVARQGEAIIGNATYKWLLRQGEKDLEVLARLLNLSEAERDLLAGAQRGHGLLIAGNQRVRMRVEAAPHELAIIDPEQALKSG